MSIPLQGEACAELRSAVRRCLERHADVRRFVPAPGGSATAVDQNLQVRLVGEMGLAGLIVPEAFGGSGAGMSELAAVFEEFGAWLPPVTVFASAALAVPAILTATDPARDDVAAGILESIASGSASATLAFAESSGRFAPGATSVSADRSHEDWKLTGEKGFVVHGADVDVLLVSAITGAGIALFTVDRTAAGVDVHVMAGMDLLRGLATVSLRGASARLIGAESGADSALESALQLSIILMAAEQVGGAQRCLDVAVVYAKTRVQFGRPIGSFQAIKHLLVDLLLEVELARSAMTHAVGIADDYLRDPCERTAARLAEAAALARSMCSDAYMRVADESLHVHGGIGFTWEHDAHLHFRRAKFCQLLFGNSHQHREKLAIAAGLGA